MPSRSDTCRRGAALLTGLLLTTGGVVVGQAAAAASTTTVASTEGLVYGPPTGLPPRKASGARRSFGPRTGPAAPVAQTPAVTPPGTLPPTDSTYVVREDAVRVPVGTDLAAAVAAAPTGATFLLAAGVHRLQEVEPKDGQTFVGEPGAVLSGARLLTGFAAEGGAWYVGGQTQDGYRQGECRSATPLCNQPNRVFVDGVPLPPVTSRTALRPGTYFFDRDADKVWLGADPAGRTVEVAVAERAFAGRGSGVTVRSLVVERYATPAQRGAVDASDGRSWLVEGVIARQNSGGGLRAGTGTVIRRSYALENGQIGVTGVGQGILVEDTEIARNNAYGFEPGWEAGGTKFALTDGLVVRRCNVHHNEGPGLWTDVDNVRTTYSENTVADNAGEGIFHEISGSARIVGNTVLRNSTDYDVWVWGAGIHVASSFDVEVAGNRVEGNGNGIVGSQQSRGSGPNGPRVLRGLNVHDNTIVGSGKVGVSQDVSDHGVFTNRGNVFDRNRYGAGQVFTWLDRDVDMTAWQGFGLDRSGGLV